MFRLTSLFLLAGSAAAATPSFMSTPDSVPADSKFGQALLRRATEIKPARHLEQQGNQWQGYEDFTFIAKYDIKYMGCASLIQINPEGNGEEGALYTQHLVKFALCPSGSCSSCSGGGEYAVNMMEFVDAYTESKLEEEEYQCEMVRENCYCENANDDQNCENQCYYQNGMEHCIEYEGQEEFEIQRYLECREMEEGGNNNNNNNQNQNNGQYYGNQGGNDYYGELFIGPYCSQDGKSIHLGVFYDEGCTMRGDTSLYSQRNYGASLPYSSDSIIDSNDCISCQEVDRDANQNQNGNYQGNNYQGNNQGYNWQQEYEVTELCEQSYEMAVKCEANMNLNYKDESGCEYLNDILPRMSSSSRSSGAMVSQSSDGGSAKAMAYIFAFTTIMFGAYSYFLYGKIKRGSAALNPGGNLA